jgi:hypothetical protein
VAGYPERNEKVRVVFLYDDTLTPEQARSNKTKYVGFQEITCHIIFDVKMDLRLFLIIREF